MPRALWRRILSASAAEVLVAVDLYNRPRHDRRVEAFFVHMHLGWLYLLHAHFHRRRIDYHYRKPGSNHFLRVDGEPKAWELATCIDRHWPDNNHPVRKNLELTIALRNKIEHRFTDASLDVAASGYAQATLLNYEREITSLFGDAYSLADSLRFPVFIGTFTRASADRLKNAKHDLPAEVRSLIDDFQSQMDETVIDDSRYEFRIHLVQQTGAKTDADLALKFVREDELTDEQRAALAGLGREGTVIVRERQRSVASAGLLRPSDAVANVAAQVPFKFQMHHFTRAWKRLQVRPATNDPHPERTDERYCIYDAPHRDYLYKGAFVSKLVRACKTEKGFRETTGLQPHPRKQSRPGKGP